MIYLFFSEMGPLSKMVMFTYFLLDHHSEGVLCLLYVVLQGVTGSAGSKGDKGSNVSAVVITSFVVPHNS